MWTIGPRASRCLLPWRLDMYTMYTTRQPDPGTMYIMYISMTRLEVIYISNNVQCPQGQRTGQNKVDIVLPQYICGERQFTIFLSVAEQWDRVVPLNFFTLSTHASSPPGTHVRGELSQQSLAYRYTCPKSKNKKQWQQWQILHLLTWYYITVQL